jgi:hypothetical protein
MSVSDDVTGWPTRSPPLHAGFAERTCVMVLADQRAVQRIGAGDGGNRKGRLMEVFGVQT